MSPFHCDRLIFFFAEYKGVVTQALFLIIKIIQLITQKSQVITQKWGNLTLSKFSRRQTDDFISYLSQKTECDISCKVYPLLPFLFSVLSVCRPATTMLSMLPYEEYQLNRDFNLPSLMCSSFPRETFTSLFDFTATGFKCSVAAVESLLVLHIYAVL